MTFVVENLDEWEQALEAELVQQRTLAEEAVEQLGEDIGRRERAAGPRGAGAHGIDTITIETGRSADLFWVDVGPDKRAFYLAFYEFGTGHQPPRPFMRPSVNEAVAAWRP
jgi:HK97 gp10 family phage protein